MRLRVIFLSNTIKHYRIPILNILAEWCDLTVAYSDGDDSATKSFDCKFNIMYLPSIKIGNRIVIQKQNIKRLVKNYDVVLSVGNIAWLYYSLLPWYSKARVVYHTIGVSASYKKGYDKHHEWDWIRKILYNKASALAFYTDYPIEKYKKMGISQEKMFVATNTVEVHPVHDPEEKDSVLFIGTLYRQKGLQNLLDAFLTLKEDKSIPVLRIIGKGPDEYEIKQWIEKNEISDKVQMMGAIFDIDEKAKYFSRAYACISPKQAGLSVLESMGYGVPFVTSHDAITGGEIFNIHNGVDGVIMQNDGELIDVIKDVSKNRQKFIQMGNNAKKYYNENCTPKHMAEGLWKAILYAYNH